MKIIFLGTNGWYSSPTGNTACILIDSKTRYVVFDAGNGIYKLDKYITENKPISLFISHFHLDHVAGFHTLGKFKFKQGIDVYVGEGRRNDFDTLVHRPYTIGIEAEKENIYNLSTKVKLHQLSAGNHDIGFPVSVHKLFHAYEDHGYRVTLENKTIAYSGDTGICPESKVFAKNADLLIHECSYTKHPDSKSWGHVTPEEAAQLAKDAHVKQLILTHFDPTHYPTLDARSEAQKRAQKIFPNTTAAKDDLCVVLK
ncbi:MAG TPA: MBL fold metallo-hydrolase [Candidatus Saccharimonadales bacterium]|nr:MBL fold metallo-hydrolase [Candidatus Saccharimonadales bacterium]